MINSRKFVMQIELSNETLSIDFSNSVTENFVRFRNAGGDEAEPQSGQDLERGGGRNVQSLLRV